MEKWAFVSRHAPTNQQLEKAHAEDIELVHIGDRDAFGVDPLGFMPVDIVGVVCVHPVMALRAFAEYKYGVGVFENLSRSGPDGKPQFSTGRFWRLHPEADMRPLRPTVS